MAEKSAKKSAKKSTRKKKVKSKSTKKVSRKPAAAKKASTKSSGRAAPVQYKFGVGDMVPDLMRPGSTGSEIALSGLKGRLAVLYFYPKDNTPGCTLEGHDFRRLHAQFRSAGCEILGVSKDSVKSHLGFREKCGFPFELLSDEDGGLCKAFDVIQMKSLYGRKFEGIERSTFVVGRDGRILKEWRKVRVDGHAAEVLDFVKSQK